MKKLFSIAILTILLLTACSPQTSSMNAGAVSTQPYFRATENYDYSPFQNPYNTHVVGNETFVYFYRAREGHNGIYSVARSETEQKMIINGDGNAMNLPAAPSIVEHGGWLYSISNHNHESQETNVNRLKQDVTGTTVVTIDGTWSIKKYNQYLVLRNEALPNNTNPADTLFEEQYRVYKLHDGPHELEEVDSSTLSEESKENIRRLYSHTNAQSVLAEQLLGNATAPNFTALQANDAFYHIEINEERINFGKTTADFSQTDEIPLSEQARQMLETTKGASMQFLNYDAEWIYFADGDVLYRLAKDGQKVETLVDSNANFENGIDVVGDIVFFAGQDETDYYIRIGDPASRRQLVFDPMGEIRY